ncbi:uncharacterized protein RCC_02681 [Ramularia collo-cygni]|uniref:Uncharacterized protein n=1 Tax=Ramularia collo-cygni TaxID=112498 RepID=A0A2D3UZZ9_9PEZI|nr:uncharacterized protein RCC_02681 [Ramularia collo-cygni]CZT16846.1 uncharacterized protein RCC_02681 [Ramularia collo-cygni]
MTFNTSLWSNKVHCVDPTRSPSGAWIFDGNQDFHSLTEEVKTEDPSRTTAECFELIGAIWDETFFERFERPSDCSHAHCPDASRSEGGAWLLDARTPIEPRVQALKAEDASRTMADCFRLLGASWCATWFSDGWEINNGYPDTIHLRFDPERTKIERVIVPVPNAEGIEEMRSGAWFIGAWGMTTRQKATANKLKRDDPELVWWQCNNRAGGKWMICHMHVLDEGGKTAEDIVWERHTNVRVV